MGVPKFFRYISERYPCLSELVKEFQIPEFDNFYLDMNGIIHDCSHPSDFDPNFHITEEQIFASIFHYLEVLFNLIKPRKIFFLAVDGVAPRAKMNQQRARRFKSAKFVELEDAKLKEQGKALPENRFDSNCITPGTVFMDRLHAQLEYFVTSKISTDPLWQRCKVILSGQQTAGEGEQKIMEYIRYLKTQPDYDPNTRHCLFGLDADLIMLGLCTHEPHFSVLRQKVLFKRKNTKRITSPDETEFFLLHLSIMREYLDLEFQELKESLPFKYNLENIIDDWILMNFLVGNDFIPNLPNLHINKGALPVLYKAYMEVLPTLDGYLNENGYLNLPRFQKYMERLAEHDMETFEETYADLAFLEEKMTTGKSDGETRRTSDLEELIRSTNNMFLDSDEESLKDDGDTFMFEFCQHKRDYYTNKLDYSKVTDEVLQSQAEGYIRAIQWNLHYYYQGCQSWSWFYPHHYSPYISDITNFKDVKLDFEMGKPFSPFEQLLAVLPARCKNLLPEVYRDLMTSPDSPIIDFYPGDFETDLNGKQQDWEAVVLIPFIDEERLLKAMEPYNSKLNSDEIRRNQHRPMKIYTYTINDLGVYKSPYYFPSIDSNHAWVKEISREDLMVEKSKLKHGLMPGVLLDVHYPGFPTFKHISYTATLKKAKVKVFDYNSTGDSMMLTVTTKELPPTKELANDLLGKIVHVNWPHLVEAKVIAIADQDRRYVLTNEELVSEEEMNMVTKAQWMGVVRSITDHYMERLAVDIGPTTVVVYVSMLEGRKYTFGPMGRTTMEKMWSSLTTPCAMQITVKDIAVHDARNRVYDDVKDAFPVESMVFMLGQPHFGSMGRVLECCDYGRLKVEMDFINDSAIQEEVSRTRPKTSYLSSRLAGTKVGINPHLLSRITGSILLDMSNAGATPSENGSKINIGLNLKFSKQNERLPGYTKRENGAWLYSLKAVNLIEKYVKKFSRVVEFISNNPNNNFFSVHEIFPGPEGVTELKEMVNWLQEQGHGKVERMKCTTEILEEEEILEIEKLIDSFTCESFKITMQVKPHLLYKNDLVFGNLPPVKTAKHQLLDRVVSIRSSYTVPTGLRGYIIGIHSAPLAADYMYDILFDKPFVGGMTIFSSPERAFRMSRASFINISDANRLSQSKQIPKNLYQPLRPSHEPKTSAFAQWNHQPPKPLMDDSDDQFRRMWSDLQGLKPQEETNVLKKMLKIDEEEKPTIEDRVKSFFDKVTKVSGPSQILTQPLVKEKVSNPPLNKYYIQLFSYYQKRNLGQPKFQFLFLDNKVVAQVHFNDGRVYTGLPCENKESACESASLQALGALGEIPLNNEALVQMEKEQKIKENQAKLSSALMKGQDREDFPPRNRAPHHSNRRNNGVPYFLPDPPSQWVGVSSNPAPHNVPYRHQYGNGQIRQKREPRETAQDASSSGSRKLSSSALEFVPLQAIIGKRNFGNIATVQSPSPATVSKRLPEPIKKPEVAPKTGLSGASSSTVKRKRRPKIAANLALDPNLY